MKSEHRIPLMVRTVDGSVKEDLFFVLSSVRSHFVIRKGGVSERM